MENKIKTAPPRDSKALSSRRGEDSRFPLEVRADNFFRDARQSFRKRKEGRKGKSVSLKLNFTLFFLLLLQPLPEESSFVHFQESFDK